MRHAGMSSGMSVLFALAGCQAAAERAESAPPLASEELAAEDSEALAQLEADFGGPNGLMDFFSTSSAERIREVLGPYGMNYVAHDVPTGEKNIADCPQYFPAADGNTWHSFDGEFYFIDGSGRPKQAYKYLPPIAAAPRRESCQTSIGQWGDAENPANDYDGGHLIGSQLGGWGGRANIVPQDANFNRGNWVQLENAAAKCSALSNGRLLYQVTVGYSNNSALVPGSFGMYLEDRVQGDSISLSFSNVDLGGSSGTSRRQQGVSFLQANGCN